MKDPRVIQRQILIDGQETFFKECKAKWVLELSGEIPGDDLATNLHQLNACSAAYDRGFNDVYALWLKSLDCQ